MLATVAVVMGVMGMVAVVAVVVVAVVALVADASGAVVAGAVWVLLQLSNDARPLLLLRRGTGVDGKAKSGKPLVLALAFGVAKAGVARCVACGGMVGFLGVAMGVTAASTVSGSEIAGSTIAPRAGTGVRGDGSVGCCCCCCCRSWCGCCRGCLCGGNQGRLVNGCFTGGRNCG